LVSFGHDVVCTSLIDGLPLSTRSTSNKVYQLLAHGQWFSPDTPVSSTNKTDRHDITQILLKVAINTIKQTNKQTKKQTRGSVLVRLPAYPFGIFWS
jgi:hypothetical protein